MHIPCQPFPGMLGRASRRALARARRIRSCPNRAFQFSEWTTRLSGASLVVRDGSCKAGQNGVRIRADTLQEEQALPAADHVKPWTVDVDCPRNSFSKQDAVDSNRLATPIVPVNPASGGSLALPGCDDDDIGPREQGIRGLSSQNFTDPGSDVGALDVVQFQSFIEEVWRARRRDPCGSPARQEIETWRTRGIRCGPPRVAGKTGTAECGEERIGRELTLQDFGRMEDDSNAVHAIE